MYVAKAELSAHHEFTHITQELHKVKDVQKSGRKRRRENEMKRWLPFLTAEGDLGARDHRLKLLSCPSWDPRPGTHGKT